MSLERHASRKHPPFGLAATRHRPPYSPCPALVTPPASATRGRRRANRYVVGDVMALFSRNGFRILAAIAARPIPDAPACHAGCLPYGRQPSRQASVVTLRACHGSCYFLPTVGQLPRQSLR